MNQAQPDQGSARRSRGTPRRLLLEAAHELFRSQGYAATSTREIARHATVSETLLFRYFESKAGLYREAVVLPFFDIIRSANEKWRAGFGTTDPDEKAVRELIGELYDVFRNDRALVAMLWAPRAMTDDPAMLCIIDEVNDVLQAIVQTSSTPVAHPNNTPVSQQDLATRTTLIMIAAMAVFGSPFYGNRRPARTEVVAALTRATLQGHLRREPPP